MSQSTNTQPMFRVSPRKCVSQGGAGGGLSAIVDGGGGGGGCWFAIVDSDSLPQCGRELVDPLIN